MATKKAAAYKKGGKVKKQRNLPSRSKPKIPTLGGSLTGLGGTGAQGMQP